MTQEEEETTVAKPTAATSKDEFWKRISEGAANRIKKLFDDSNLKLSEIIGGDGEIKTYVDAKKALAYVLCHAETNNEKACAILSACEWLHSCNEMRKHSSAF